MTQSLDRPLRTTTSQQQVPARSLWQVAGWLALAHVVLLFAGLALQDAARLDEGVAGIERAYVDGSMARTMTGGLVELVGFLLLLPVLVFLSSVIGRRTDLGRWATQTAVLAGVGYLALTFAPGMAAGAAAMHAAQNGVSVEAAWMMNNLRVLSYVISLLFLGTHAIALGIAAISDGFRRRWVGWGGIVTGVALLASTPLAAWNLHDYGTLVWLVWWIGVAICLLRHRPES